MKRLLSLLVGTSLALVSFAQTPETVPTSAGSTMKALPASLVGAPAPEFNVVGSKGEAIKLSDYRGKILIVDVSATWCGPCQAAMPNNDRVFKKYADQGVVLIGVTADDTREYYDGWISRNAAKYQFKMTFDPAGRDGWKDSVFNTAYHVSGFPTMFVIGRDGKVLELVSGGGPGEDYRLEYALARAGVKVDLASIPVEPKKDPNGPKFLPMMGKTPAMKASTGMMGMGAAPGSTKFGSVEAGAMVPDFTATSPDGKPVKLSDFRDKTVILTFFSNSERGPENYVAPAAAKYADQKVVLLAVASAMEKEKFDAWIAKAKPAYATAWDPSGKSWADSITNLNFGVGMFPALIVVAPGGKLVGGFIGMGDNGARLHGLLMGAGVKLAPEDRTSIPSATIKPHKPEAGAGMAAATAVPLLGAGAVAPDFTSFTVDGKPVKISDFKGKIVILDFWATWCGPCMQSLPHTQEVAAKYKDQDVVVLASCTSDTKAMFETWVKKNQAKYPDIQFTTDPNERGSATFDDRASSKLFHVRGIPTQFVIGRDGKVAGAIVGYDTGDVRSEALLARLGVKVDAAVAAEGEKALKKSADDEVTAAAQAKAEKANPKPPFRESFAKVKGGEVVPDFEVQKPDGTTAKFSDFAKGKTVIFDFWATWCGPCQMAMPHYEEAYKKYQDQGLVVLGLCCFDTREAYDKWLVANKGKYTFPTVFDPAGKPKFASADEQEKMTPDEKAAEKAMEKKYYGDVIANRVFGAFPMLPTTLVINSEGRLLGTYAGYSAGPNEALSNLLLRAGIKLAKEDLPARVWTAAETKEAPPEARVQTLKVGGLAPDFAMTDVDGKSVKVSDFKGKVVVLDFWATWCGPCMASMPHTQEVAAHYKDQGVVILGSCTSDTRAKFDGWVKTNQAKYPDFIFAHDPAESKPERASHKLYGVQGIPTQFIIDRDGKVVDIVIGYLKGESILDAALAKAGVKVDPALVAKGAEDLKKRGG